MNKNIEGVGEVQTPSTAKEKAQNFWYHYKWHSIVAIFVVIAIVICSLQLCGRKKYDAYILYAGSHNIGRTASDGDVAEIATVISSLKRIAKDYDKNGEISISFTNFLYLTPEQAASDPNYNDALLASDQKSLSGVLENSEYYLLFISVGVYEEYHAVGDGEMFINLTEYAAYNTDAEFYAPGAIYLSSIDASRLPGLANLPDDTLICIRQPSILGGKSKEHTEHFENAKEMLINLLRVDMPE